MAMRALATRLNRSWWILAAGCLAAGSFLLLIPVVVWQSGGGTGVFVLRFAAIGIHGLAWMFLGLAITGTPRPAPAAVAYLLSIVSFVVGLATIGLALPERTGGMLNLRLGDRLLWEVFFPYVPSVFAPVVAAHGVVFLVAAPSPSSSLRIRQIALGSVALFVTSAVALTVQFAGGFEGVAYALAGLTSFGYLLVAWGLAFDSTPPTPEPRSI